MLYRTLLKLKERNGLTDDLKNKIDIFFATGRITEEQYNDLMDVNKEEKTKIGTRLSAHITLKNTHNAIANFILSRYNTNILGKYGALPVAVFRKSKRGKELCVHSQKISVSTSVPRRFWSM